MRNGALAGLWTAGVILFSTILHVINPFVGHLILGLGMFFIGIWAGKNDG